VEQPRLGHPVQARTTRALGQVGEPRVDHVGLGPGGERSRGELRELPDAAGVAAAADLEDERLAALAGERGEVVVQVVDRLEIDVELHRRDHPPPLGIGLDVRGSHGRSGLAVDRDQRVEQRRVALAADPEQVR